MTWSAFRPSDDTQVYGYLVPSNMFAVVALSYVAEMAEDVWRDTELRDTARALAKQIDDGIRRHAIVQHPRFGRVYAYEVDGLGNYLLMDDANIPSLMSIPYLGYNYDPEVYQNTRRLLLSTENKNYAESHDGRIRGIGSEHTDLNIPHNIWHMSLLAQGLTTADLGEKQRLLEMLVSTTGGTGLMHESFDPNNPSKFTRSWFSWANSLFAEFVMSMTDQCP